jgi:tape measure domain-containing protein
MSANDDTRIVNMRINNKDFLKGTSESVRALDTLNKGIDGAGKGKGLQTMAKDVDTVRTKFGALQIAGVTALANITNRAVNAGINLVKSFTIAPIMDGFREYEKLLTSTQTIVANTGKSARTAGIYLDALNAYSDETVYNFGQMAENIGRFTAAGINVKDATTAIKGLANSAALGGSTTEQLNNAMYQTSQALATGTIKLMDWNSLSQAGLGGQNIQNALKETAKTVKGSGPIMESAIKKYGSFRESLRTGWLTGSVFTKTMKVMAGQTLNAATSVTNMKHLGLDPLTIASIRAGDAIKFTTKDVQALTKKGFTEAQIGALEMGKSVGYSVKRLKELGYSDEAAKKLAKLSQASIDSATKIKTFSQLMDVLRESVGSVWAGIFRQIFGNLEEAGDLWTKVGNTITDAVGRMSRAVNIMLQTWHKTKDTETGLTGYQMLWQGLGNIFKSIGNLLRPLLVLIGALLPTSENAGGGLLSLTSIFYQFSVWLENVTSNTSKLNPVMSALGDAVKSSASVVGAAFGIMIKIVGAVIDSYVDLFMIFLPLGQAIGRLVNALFILGGGLLQLVGIGDGITGVGDAFSSLGSIIGTVFGKFVSIRNAILIPFVDTLVTMIDALTALVSGDIDFDTFKNTIASAFSGLKVDYGDLYGKAKEAAGNIISGLKDGLGGDGSVKAAIGGWVNGFVEFFKGLLGIHSPSTVFEGFGGDIVAGLVNGIKSGLSSVVGVLGSLGSKVKDWFKDLDGVDLANAFSLAFSGAALITLKRFMDGLGASMSTFKGFADDIRENVTGKNGILNQTTSTMKTMQTGIRAKAILNIALALLALSVSLFLLSKIPAKDMAKGLAGLAGVMAIMIVGLKAMGGFAAITAGKTIPMLYALSGALVIMSVGLLILAAALWAFSKVIAVFAKIDWKVFADGLGKIAITLLALGIAMTPLALLAPGVLIASAALIVLSVGLMAMLGALLAFSKVDFNTILEGVAKMAVVLLGLGLAIAPLALLSPLVLIASAALVVLGVALVAILGVIKMFSEVSFGTIISGVAKIAVALVAIGIAAGIAAAGFVLLGIGALLIGAGLMAAGIGMGLLGAGLAIVAGAGAAAFAVLIAGIETFVAALPVIGTQLVGALDTILKALASRAPSIVDSIITTIREVLRGIVELAPDFAAAAMSLINTFITFLADNVAALVSVGLRLIGGFIQGIADGASAIIGAVANLIVAFLTGLTEHLPDIIAASMTLMTTFIQGIADNLPALVEAGANLIIAFLQGLGQQAEPMAMAAGQLILDFLTAINTAITTYMPQITQQGLLIGQNLILGLIQGLVPDFIYEAFSSFVQNILTFFKGLLGINSPSTVFAGFGRNIVEGLANGISSLVGMATGAIGNLIGKIVGAVKALPGRAASALSSLGGALKGAFSAAFSAAIGAVSSGVSKIGAGIGKLPGLIKGVASTVGGAAAGIGKAIIDGIGKGVAGIGNWVADLGGKLKNAVNSALHLPKRISLSINKGPIHINTGVTIPGFAKGVTNFGGGSALVGEAGPEIVTMGRGSNVLTNENLIKFMKSVTSLTRSIMSGSGSPGASPNANGQINYVVGADFKGDPKASGIAFAANIVAGLVGGLQSNQSSANAAMTNLGSSTTQAFADVLGIHSPSTVFAQLGGFVSKGFINGLVASTRGVANASAALANAGLGEVIRVISDSNLQFEVSKAFENAYASAADLVRKKAAKADKKGKGGKSKRGDRQAKRLEKEAKQLDKLGKKSAAAADREQAQIDAREAAIERQAEYAKAYKDDDKSKIADMKKEDALNAAKAASSARQKAIALQKEAKLVEKYDKKRAKKLREQAAKYEAEARRLGAIAGTAATEAATAAGDAAKQEADELAAQAAQIKAQLTSVTAEQVVAAQQMFDTYAQQMSDVAAAAAQDTVPQVTYEQNIYSPEALSPGEVYRNSKNLLSMTERTLVGASAP